MICTGITAQDLTYLQKDTTDGMYRAKVILEKDYPADQAYQNARSWVAKAYKNSQNVIQMDTPDRMIMKGIFNIKHGMNPWAVSHTMQIDIKEISDGKCKVRLTLDNFSYNHLEKGGDPIIFELEKTSAWNSTHYLKKIMEKTDKNIGPIISSFQGAMNNAKNSGDDW